MTMINQVEIQSDAWSRLKTIRSGVVYDNILTFLYELIQNSQRANASSIYISVHGDTFTIIDDGKGCPNPKDLFTMDFSGFGVGYGIGFTSVYPIADRIDVETANWRTTLDMNKAIDEKNLFLAIEPTHPVSGFHLTLKGEKISEYEADIIDKSIEIASIIPDIDIRVNGDYVHKVDLFEPPTYTNQHGKVNNRIYEGRLVLNNLEKSSGIEVYYEHRHVCRIYLEGVRGNILIKPGKINLKAPDRKSIIWDYLRDNLYHQLRSDIADLCKKAVKQSTDEEKEDLANTIDLYLGVSAYIRYLMMDEADILNQYETREAAEANEKAEEESEAADTEEAFREEEQQEQVSFFVADNERHQEDITFHSFVSAHDRDLVQKGEQVSISTIKRKKNVVWVKKKEEDQYQDLITKYAYYGIHTFVSPHVLYDRALEHLGITHIADVEHQAIEKKYSVTRTGARNKKEMRAMELLSFIERELGFGETFYLSDIDCRMVVNLNESKIYQQKLEVEGYEQGGRIHLDRKSLEFGRLSGSHYGRVDIGINDIKFVMSNIVLIAHEMSHLYGTHDNTIGHYQQQDALQKKIGKLFLERTTL